MSLEADIAATIRTLYKYGRTVRENQQRIAGLGGSYAAAAADAAAPRSLKPHYRYSTPKLNNKLRAPKGMGKIVATYYPGNLGTSIRVLRFARAQSKVFVGAKLAKGVSPQGNFGRGARADGYYLHMVEKGTRFASARPFFRNAIERSRSRVNSIMLTEWQKLTVQFEQQNKVT